MWRNPWRSDENVVRCRRVDPIDPSSAYRSIECLNELKDELDDIETLADLPQKCLEKFPKKKTLGTRQIHSIEQEKQSNGKLFKKYLLGEYEYLTYEECFEQINSIGRSFLSLNLNKNESILIFSETRREWFLTALTTFRHGYPLVTLYPTLGEDALRHAIQQTQTSTIVISKDLFSKLNKILDDPQISIRTIIYFSSIDPNDNDLLQSNWENIQIIPFEQFKLRHLTHHIDENRYQHKPKPDDIAVIMYTSGSTGVPKGVLIEHRNILSSMVGQRERLSPLVDLDKDIYIAYLPLAHILELTCEILVYYLGIELGYSSPQTLTDQSTAIRKGDRGDLQILRPHLMCSVPTILDRIHKSIEEKINQMNFVHRNGFHVSYQIKLKRSFMGLSSPHLDQYIFSRLNSSILGGRMKTMICGGALLSEQTQQFIRTTLCLHLLQGYGLTETCASATLPHHEDLSVGRVGYPLISCEIRLKNWDEGNYRNSDFPHPRGEILIGGSIVARGYFNSNSIEEDNFQQINGINYFATGDIGEIYPDGSLKIIDRKKDLVKLRGGEYLSLTKVEMVMNKLPFVDQSCLFAQSSAEYSIVLLCPNRKSFQEFSFKHFGESNWKILLENRRNDLEEILLKEIEEFCRKNRIEKFEIPQRIILIEDIWTPESGLLTDALKLKRKAIENKYRDEIEECYHKAKN